MTQDRERTKKILAKRNPSDEDLEFLLGDGLAELRLVLVRCASFFLRSLPNGAADADVVTQEFLVSITKTMSRFAGRAKEVRAELKGAAKTLKKMQLKIAILLQECRDRGYWAEQYSTFTQYVECEVGMPMRTAQELMRVLRKCTAANIDLQKIAELGWSKLALVASQLTKENATDLLTEVENKSYGQLKELLRQDRKKKASTGKSLGNKNTSLDKSISSVPGIFLSANVLQALQCASLHTRDVSTQANLEFMAEKFVELCPPPARIPEDPNWN